MERIIKFEIAELTKAIEEGNAHQALPPNMAVHCTGGFLSVYLEDIDKGKPRLVAACGCGWRKEIK